MFRDSISDNRGKGGLKSIRKKVRKQLYNYIKMSESNVYELDFIS